MCQKVTLMFDDIFAILNHWSAPLIWTSGFMDLFTLMDFYSLLLCPTLNKETTFLQFLNLSVVEGLHLTPKV